MCRVVCRSLYEIEESGVIEASMYSMYDAQIDRDSRYITIGRFKGFAGQRTQFVISSLLTGRKSDVLILSHLNLLFVAALIRAVNPGIKIFLFAHGIEIWPKLSGWRTQMLRKINVIAVSNFTRNKVTEVHGLDSAKVSVLNNALDPFYEFPTKFVKPLKMLKRYRIHPLAPVLFTLTRLASSEKYKGYDSVIEAMPEFLQSYPDLQYLIAGKYDEAEKVRIDKLIGKLKLQEHVHLLGFLDEIELTEHFLLADVFIMPSKKEGFGIVFIEAMASGLPVIGGNQDGTVDALRNGELGTLINPEDPESLKAAIRKHLENPLDPMHRKKLQASCQVYFEFEHYTKTLRELLHV